MFDDAECDQQFIIWKEHAANHGLQMAHALMEAMRYAPEGEEVSPFINLADFLLQKCDTLRPDGAAFPEYPDNVIPMSKGMRRK